MAQANKTAAQHVLSYLKPQQTHIASSAEIGELVFLLVHASLTNKRLRGIERIATQKRLPLHREPSPKNAYASYALIRTPMKRLIQLAFAILLPLASYGQTCTISGTQNFPGVCDEDPLMTALDATDLIIAAGANFVFDDPNEVWEGNTLTIYGILRTTRQTQEIIATGGITVDGGTFNLNGNATVGSSTVYTDIEIVNGGTLQVLGNSTSVYGDITADGSSGSQDNIIIGTNGELTVFGDVYVGTPADNGNAYLDIQGRLLIDGEPTCDNLLHVYGIVNASSAGSNDKIIICDENIFVGGTSGASCVSIVGMTPQEIVDAYDPNTPYCLDSTFVGPLVFGDDTVVLPVEIVGFAVRFEGDYVDCQWATASEQDNSHFEVQRSLNGREFEAIGQIQGAGTTNILQRYRFLDREYRQGYNYYRLKQVDHGGSTAYSRVAVVFVGDDRPEADLLVFPNPSKTGHIEVSLFGAPLQSVVLYDLTGKPVRQWQAYEAESRTALSTEGLPAGTYIMSVETGSQQVLKKKVILE
jgi:hypothetical protein